MNSGKVTLVLATALCLAAAVGCETRDRSLGTAASIPRLRGSFPTHFVDLEPRNRVRAWLSRTHSASPPKRRTSS